MDSMTTSEKLLNIVDLLQSIIDEHIQDHEALTDAYKELLDENDRLRDAIAIMAQDKQKDLPNE